MLSPETAGLLGLRPYPGWTGWHTRAQAPGAIANGTRIRKAVMQPGDTHAVGAIGTVLGSLHLAKLGYAYFVAWEAHPQHAVFVTEKKIEPAADTVNRGEPG